MRKRLMTILLLLSFLFFVVPVSAEEITDIDDIERAGSYLVVVVAYDQWGNPIRTTFRIHVLMPRSIIDLNLGEGIDAHDVFIEQGLIHQLSALELIDLASAHAWRLDDGRSVPVAEVILHDSDVLGVSYFLTFATRLGTATTVNVFEVAEIILEANISYVHLVDSNLLGGNNLMIASLILLSLVLWPLIILTVAHFFSRKKIKMEIATLYGDNQ